jgi:hypothetical protein
MGGITLETGVPLNSNTLLMRSLQDSIVLREMINEKTGGDNQGRDVDHVVSHKDGDDNLFGVVV